VAVAYFGAARLGLLQELVRGQVTPFWPPTGIAVVCLLLMGLRVWPGIAVGAFVVNASVGGPLAAAVLIAIGNTVAPVCACLLLRRVGFRDEIDRRRDALALVFLGALAAMLVSATIGACALFVTGAIGSADFWPTWSVWWTGDAMGVLLVAPFLLVLRRLVRWPLGIQWFRYVEMAALLLGTFAVTVFAMRSSTAMLFLVSPFLIWAALRFQLAGAAPCALIASTVAIFAAAHESGPFAQHDLFTNMLTLQAFNGTTTLTALVLAAIIAEGNRAYLQIELACTQLAQAVSQLERTPFPPLPHISDVPNAATLPSPRYEPDSDEAT
jgi:integral membrane sensor domain MASE1